MYYLNVRSQRRFSLSGHTWFIPRILDETWCPFGTGMASEEIELCMRQATLEAVWLTMGLRLRT
jgi:hypothetical protein